MLSITAVRVQHNCLTKFMCAFSHITKMSDPRAVLWLFTDRVNCISVQLMLLGSTEATFIATNPGSMNILSHRILPQNVSF